MTTAKNFLLSLLLGASLNNHAFCMDNNNKKRPLDNDSKEQDNSKRIKQFDDEQSKALLKECHQKNASLEIIKKLLEKNADVNTKDNDDGFTPLYLACTHDNLQFDTLKLLIDNKADVNAQTDYGYTPLYLACAHSKIQLDILKLLIDNKADVNAQTDHGHRPLHTACANGNLQLDVLKLLIDNKADLNTQTNYGFTPLHMACNNNNPSRNILKFIIFYPFSNLKNTILTYLLCLKIQQKKTTIKVPKVLNLEIFKLMINTQALHDFINIKNKYGKTALMIAQNRRESNLILFLQSLDAPIDKLWKALLEFWEEQNQITKK